MKTNTTEVTKKNQGRGVRFQLNMPARPHDNDSITKPQNFPQWLSQLGPDQAQVIAKAMTHSEQLNLEQLYQDNPAVFNKRDKKTLRKLLETHSIAYLNGNHSKHFLITHLQSHETMVLTLENRLGNPKTQEEKLRKTELSTLFLKVYAEQAVTIYDKQRRENTAAKLQIIEYCQGSDLIAYKKTHCHTPEQVRAAAAVIYLNMDQHLQGMLGHKVAFTDPKNTNWLIQHDNEHNKPGLLKIGDTKTLVPISTNKQVNMLVLDSKGYTFLCTPRLKPPESTALDSDLCSDATAAYMLGKNIYDFLSPDETRTSLQNNHNASTFIFAPEVFDNPVGIRYQQLIQALVKPDPKARMSLTDAQSALQVIALMQQHPEVTTKHEQLMTQYRALVATLQYNGMPPKRQHFQEQSANIKDLSDFEKLNAAIEKKCKEYSQIIQKQKLTEPPVTQFVQDHSAPSVSATPSTFFDGKKTTLYFKTKAEEQRKQSEPPQTSKTPTVRYQ